MKIRSISISHSITKTKEEKDHTLKLEKDILNLEDIMNSAPSELIQSSQYPFPLLARLAEKVKVIAEWSVLFPGIIFVFFISEKRSSDTRK
jgi:hypothetical protein